MAHAARALGLGVMLGCMVESGLGIAAGAQIASLCDHVDLDGNLLLADDPWPGVEFVDGVQLPSDRAGPRRRDGKRYLILAEGRSRRPALRQDRARRHPLRPRAVVAILDSRARGGDRRGLPDRRRPSTTRSRFEPDDRARRRRHAGRPLPAGVARAAAASASPPGSTSRTACTSSSPTTPSWPRSPREHGVELRDLRKPPAGPQRPDRREPRARRATIVLTVGSDCAIGKMTVALELDREARRRGLALRVRPDRPDRDRDRRLGDRRRRGRLRLHRRRRRAARRRGRRARRRPALGRGPGLAAPSRLLRRHARADPRLGAARLRPLPPGRAAVVDDDERFPIPPLLRARRPARADRRCSPGRPRVAAIALNTRNLDEDAARAAIEAAEAETGLPADDPVRFGAARLVDALALLAPR